VTKPLRSNIVELRERVLEAAWWGAVAALDEMTDDEVRRISDFDDITGKAARWLLAYRETVNKRRRSTQEALHEWRLNGRSV
jgi:hypothetical protein